MFLFFLFTLLLQYSLCTEITICENDSQNLACPGTDVLRIFSAQWGRTTRLKCPKEYYDANTNCTSSVTDKIRKSCGGKNSCSIQASNDLVDGKDPCFGTFKYLDINYNCRGKTQNVKVCEGKRLVLNCPMDRIIRIQSALYGRHSTTPCPQPGNDHFVNCGLDETRMVKTVCDGLQTCNMEVGINTFKTDPCVGTYKYTDVNYFCEPKIPGEQRQIGCYDKTFSISCPLSKKIQIIQASYGRYSKAICPSKGSDGNTQCATIQTNKLIKRCDGLRSCSLKLNKIEFPNDPCPETYKYLSARYLCK